MEKPESSLPYSQAPAPARSSVKKALYVEESVFCDQLRYD